MRVLICLMAIAGLISLSAVTSYGVASGEEQSLVWNGDFEAEGFWTMSGNAQRVAREGGGMCVAVTNNGHVMQDIPAEGLSGPLSVACEIKTENVAAAGGPGYAYVAVYQLDENNELVAFRDFGQLTGTHDWQRFTWTFQLAPNTITVSLRCGIYNATGKAWFDNWTLVSGERALSIEEVRQPLLERRPAKPRAAILREPELPVVGAASQPERLGKLLARAGYEVEYLSAAELADRKRLLPGRYTLVVLPYGASFPAEARRAFVDYLHRGGSFLAMGGYAFNQLWRWQGGRWRDEQEIFREQLAEALKHSILPDGGFEATATAQMPVGGRALDGLWRRNNAACTIASEEPHEGQRCAKVVVSPEQRGEQCWYCDLAPPKSGTCRISAWIRTEDVAGAGYAYMAVYQYRDEELVAAKDFCQLRGTTPWSEYRFEFMPKPNINRLHIKLGLYRASGTAYFDEVRLCVLGQTRLTPMNTSSGKPEDGLTVAPWQIGVFDASFPLRRAVRLEAGGGQYFFAPEGSLAGVFRGWAAAGVQGDDNARWVELLAARDRFGRPRGAAAALMLHYNGYFSGSMWAYFGVENVDLFDGRSSWLDEGLVNVARFIGRGLFLRNLQTEWALYQPGEAVRCRVYVQNYGIAAQACRVRFGAYRGGLGKPVWTATQTVTAPAGKPAMIEATWASPRFDSDVYQLRAVLLVEDKAIDELQTGFLVRSPAAMARGPQLRFRENYLHLNGTPLFVFGSDTYANVYKSACENPWTWHLDHVAARDFGFNLYENLQFVNPDWTYEEAEWRQFEAMAQSCQREGLLFMPCQLCGHNVAIGEKPLAQQAALCAAYAQHMRPYPGILYYINGDFQFQRQDREALSRLWNEWLRQKYGEEQAWREAWGESEIYGRWGALEYPPPAGDRWDSAREADLARFDVYLTRRWVERHVQAIRKYDPDHPITSEYYQRPSGGLDLLLTIDGQDLSNFGYFRKPQEDIEYLPLHLRLNDLRVRGKSVSLGEYGVKTHPAWTIENGASGYHIVRTEEQQKELFLAVASYAFALGACKIQNWCLRDASERVFPWGVFYPNGRVPKDVAYWHRNISLIWRFLRPQYMPANVTVLLPDSLRLGPSGELAIQAAFNAFRTLLALGVHFNVLNEENIEALPATTKLLIWPTPYCPEDKTYARVREFVRAGGRLLVTGDLSFNWNRKRTRLERLRELCGVEYLRELAPAPERGRETRQTSLGGQAITLRPALEVKPITAAILAADIYRQRLGAGEVIYCADPLEFGEWKETQSALMALYGFFVGPLPRDPILEGLLPAEIPAHRLRQPLRSGGAFYLAYPLQPLPGEEIRYPRFVVRDRTGAIVAASLPRNSRVAEAKFCYAMALALDGKPLERSRAWLVTPFGTGRWSQEELQNWRGRVVLFGDIQNGRWRTLEMRPAEADLSLDEDTMTCLLLVCERSEASRWIKLLEEAATQPWKLTGY